ncbi:class IV lanthionine synthetase LanL [Krasilnikovia sp. MM14-A1259]|uniref:class IV lanthionine synthetase LanL n=1 Tax=Krasilnikovia sp. MM14-A1259 TaxID=3373539 RepID=UPI00399D146E
MDEKILQDCVRSVLGRHGDDWRVEPGDMWCYVHPGAERARVQGWKLHVSATVLSAPLVLSACAEILARHRCAFKFAATLRRVRELGSRQVARGGGGKFITAYPECGNHELRALADELDRATALLPGPSILSDRPVRPGSRVHYRFGAHTGVPMLGNDGVYEAMLVAPDGRLVSDRRKAWFSPPAWAPRDPFAARPSAAPASPAKAAPKAVLLDGRYVVREVIRHAFTGSVYRATDQQTGAEVIVKQARPHTGTDLTGRDARDIRRHEAAMLDRFAGSGLTPRPVALFEQQGDLFLVQEAVSGCTLRQWASRNVVVGDDAGWGPPGEQAARLASGLVDLLAAVHAEGLVVQDFGPNNVMVTDDGDLRLIDLETLARPGDQVARAYTPGYAAPELVSAPDVGPAPQPAADLYSLGATLFHLVSGVDPILPDDGVPARPAQQRIARWMAHFAVGNEPARQVAGVVVALLDVDPARRPGLDEVRDQLRRADRPEPFAEPCAPQQPEPSDGRHAPEQTATDLLPDGRLPDDLADRMIADGIDHLLATMRPDADDRLWPCGASGTTTDPFNVQHGAAGILAVLTRAAQQQPDSRLTDAVATAAAWIARRVDREPRILPGLYFGRAGTAWALLDAGRLLGDDTLVDLAVDLALQLPLRWPNPDVCHGTAGAGLTQLRFWEHTGRIDFLDRARGAADAVADAARRRGALVDWPIPADFPSELAGLAHYGFAHGIAGVAAFLLAAGRATGTSRYLTLADTGAATLEAAVQLDRGGAYWTSGADTGVRKTHWCSGSSGIGTFLTQMWRETGTASYGELAAQAAVAVRRSRWHAGPSQCHGLAGDAEFLLDLADASGERRYREWARELAGAVQLRHAVRDGRMLAPDETATDVVPDYNTGLSGVLAMLLRLRGGTRRMWLPAAFTGHGRRQAPQQIPAAA